MAPANPVTGPWWVWPAVLLAGVYGGYFGAAQGVLLMGIMGIGIPEDAAAAQRAQERPRRARERRRRGCSSRSWRTSTGGSSALIGVGSVIGGQVGATVGRRLPTPVLRGVIVVVGVVALTVFLFS